MELRQLKYFYHVCRAGSFSAAAQDAYVTQQAISAAITGLEKEFGAPLFDRTSSGVELNDCGRIVLKRVEDVFEVFAAMQTEIEEYKKDWEGKVSFAFATNMIASRGGPFSFADIEEFTSMYPNLKTNIIESSREVCLSLLEQNSVDLALIPGPPESDRFESRKLNESAVELAVPIRHPLAKKNIVSFKDLEGESILMPSDLDCSYNAIIAGCRKYGFEPVFKGFPNRDYIEFVSSGRGVAFLPAGHEVARQTSSIALIPLVKNDSYLIPHFLVYKKMSELTPSIRLLRMYIINKYSLNQTAADSSSNSTGPHISELMVNWSAMT